ncbi:MAG: ABC transporter ATP-binding protein [Chloroflexi bacterium]|nr:ABC transporter ATP-binding protein [Chloroflexota bacterium]
MSEALLTLHDAVVHRGRRAVLQVPHLEIFPHEVLAVIGPNGAGKTTLLLALAALLPLEQGELRFRGQVVQPRRALAYRRRIAVVLQEPLLLRGTVYDNVALGLRLRGLDEDAIAARVEPWLRRLNIAHLAQRPARRLSGGEARRVSLARALVLQPDILFLDEPFNALDTPTRNQLLDDLQALFRAEGITAVYITHDFGEALALGRRVAVVMDGRLRQVGPPQEVFTAPHDVRIARFVGVETVLPGRVQSQHAGYLRIALDAGWTVDAVGQAPVGAAVYACLRPDQVTVWRAEPPAASSARNRCHGRVQRLMSLGAVVKVVVDCQGAAVVAHVTQPSLTALDLHEGAEVWLTFKASAVHVVPRG